MRRPRSWNAGCSSGSDPEDHTLLLPGTLPVVIMLGQSFLGDSGFETHKGLMRCHALVCSIKCMPRTCSVLQQ